MNKLTKAAIAGGAGIILLMGGAGTFAVWNDSAVAGNATITAGDLAIAPSATAATWSSQTGPIANIAAYRIVPGDVLTFTQTFDITAIGDNLKAKVDISAGSIVAADTANTDDAALAALLSSNATVAVGGSGVTEVVAGKEYSFASGARTVTVSATITFPGVATTGQKGAVSLSGFAVALTQTITP